MRRLAISLLLLAGCAHAPATTTTTTPHKPLTVNQRLDNMTVSIEKRDFAGAIADTDEWLAEHPDLDTEGLIYNCRTWIRWGSGDKKGAAAENEKLREIVANAAPKVQHGKMLHYWWDRSYLEAEAGKLADAEKSRAEFFAIATSPDDADSKNVLEAWLAFRRGEGDKARDAAKRVDPAKDGDLQDLYVLACALESGGDTAGAASIRDRIRNGDRYPMKPTILQQMERDTTRCQ
jgi:hypothetical protein